MENTPTNIQILSIAQTLIQATRSGSATDITPALIEEKVKVAASLVGGASEAELSDVAHELIRRFSHWIGQDSKLSSSEGHEVWLNAERRKGWRYWQRLQTHLEKRLPVDVVGALDRSTDGILGLLEDPRRPGFWDRRGLVVGHVQSGKTSSYSALTCKAADAGYKVIIVLAGLHNNLRTQTQIRLEEAFLGYDTSETREGGRPIGVGEEDSDPAIHPHCATTRAADGDFSTKVARHFAISPEERPWLFVVKKNKTVLTRLLKWIRSHVADATDAASGRRYVGNLPLLVIDDEADHASVDTGEQVIGQDGKPDEDHQPKAINSLIRKILHSFSKSAYVGYTATPFANIFIHRKNETPEEGPDLFPSSFIINLAAPSNYVGPAKIFGSLTPEGRVGGLPLTRIISDHASKDEVGGWMPPKHRKEHVPLHEGQDAVPPSLQRAVMTFVLACTARAARGQGKSHSSMLVHVTRFTDVQRLVHQQVETLVTRLRRRISHRIDDSELLEQMRLIWIEDLVPTSQQVAKIDQESRDDFELPPWKEVVDLLPNVLDDISVRIINGTAKDALDYAEHSTQGLKVIAIGGDKLARGLTLEGLCVSYFVRSTKMYDTLMQMGRWFGYRPGHLDLCRLFTTSDLIQWFGHITDASEELREEFDEMVRSGAIPRDYGLKVLSHPVLLVTSPLKMRSAQTLRLSYSGSLAQTVAFRNDEASLRQNLDAAMKLVQAIGKPGEIGISRSRGGSTVNRKRSFLWSGCASAHVLEFLSNYASHPSSTRANSLVLLDFISKMNDAGQLTEWTIGLMADGPARSPFQFSDHVTIETNPTRTDTQISGRCSIGVLTDPDDESLEMGAEEWDVALRMTIDAWENDGTTPKRSRPEAPGGKMIRKVRGLGAERIPARPERGLLLIYPLHINDPGHSAIPKEWADPLIAFAISFPDTRNGVTVEYKVDHKLWGDEYGPAD